MAIRRCGKIENLAIRLFRPFVSPESCELTSVTNIDDSSTGRVIILSYSNQHFVLDPDVHDEHEVEEAVLRIDFKLMLTRWRFERMKGYN